MLKQISEVNKSKQEDRIPTERNMVTFV